MKKIYNFSLSYKKRLGIFRHLLREMSLNIDEARSVFYSNSERRLRMI